MVRGLAFCLHVSCTRCCSAANATRRRRWAKALHDKQSESTVNLVRLEATLLKKGRASSNAASQAASYPIDHCCVTVGKPSSLPSCTSGAPRSRFAGSGMRLATPSLRNAFDMVTATLHQGHGTSLSDIAGLHQVYGAWE